MAFRSETVEAVIEALDAGIFVVAAAGNNGMRSSVDDVSVPASLVGVIAVGASTSKGGIWLNSSKGSETDPHSGLDRVFPNQKPEVTAPGVRMFSTASTSISPPYAYSTGTSDSTVLVAGALALILELYGDAIRGEDGILDADEMSLVKRALATSALAGEETDSGHHQKRGYGDLNAVSWAEQVAFELNLD
jgi:subtilisin family serine protease